PTRTTILRPSSSSSWVRRTRTAALLEPRGCGQQPRFPTRRRNCLDPCRKALLRPGEGRRDGGESCQCPEAAELRVSRRREAERRNTERRRRDEQLDVGE